MTSEALAAPQAAEADLHAAESMVRCPCPMNDGRSCGKMLVDCSCSWAVEYRAELTDLLADGRTPREAALAFADAHGGTWVLSRPPAEGWLNLAYVVPLAVALAGLVAAVTLARRWARPPDADREPWDGAAAEPASPEDMHDEVERQVRGRS